MLGMYCASSSPGLGTALMPLGCLESRGAGRGVLGVGSLELGAICRKTGGVCLALEGNWLVRLSVISRKGGLAVRGKLVVSTGME